MTMIFAILLASMVTGNTQATNLSRPCGATLAGSHTQPQGAADLEGYMPIGVYLHKRRPLAVRLWSKIEKQEPEKCWPWLSCRDKRGYGVINSGGCGLRTFAHRVVWMLTHGAIPQGMCVLHRCDNPPCCNPAHLFLGTKADNLRDAAEKGRMPRGEAHWRAKLTECDVREIRQQYAAGNISQRKLAKMFHVSEERIHSIVYRLAWKHVA